jgi:hypothetical protein
MLRRNVTLVGYRMKKALSMGRWLLLGAAIAGAGSAHVRAIVLRPTSNDIERALALSRWPHSDTERAQFHKRYTITVNGQATDSWAVEQIEVITEFRRVELMAEEHGRINDSWGRGGLRDVEEAIRPWRGQLSIVVHLGLRASLFYVDGVPPIEIAVDGTSVVATADSRRSGIYASCGDDRGCPLIGGLVEKTLDAASVGQTTRSIRVLWKGKQLAQTTIDFAALD